MPADHGPDVIDGLPNISGGEAEVEAATRGREPVFLKSTPIRLEKVQSAFAIALHMHQPLVLQEGELSTARLMGNLEYMMERKHVHGCHDAPAFAWCYQRMGEFIPELVRAGRHPRVMLDYPGELLFGLRQMGRGDILDSLKRVTAEPPYRDCVEWLGTMWGHAVAASTPVPDLKLHMRAWQRHFAALFGWEALSRVRGFSPPEMSLPNHPDVCYEYVRALRDCGYQWLLVQEHTVEELDGAALRERFLPRRLTARDSRGREVSITALIKTQGSDTKLVAHMQPLSEARGLQPRTLAGKRVPSLVAQISDGENGGVMMNEFPDHFKRSWHELGTEGVVGLNGTEYLELLAALGIAEKDFEPIQPRLQSAVWRRLDGQASPERLERVIEELRRADNRFSMDGGSWTNDISWVRGYENVLDPIKKLSARFHEVLDGRSLDTAGPAYRNALFHLLVAESSDYRYWGQGRWTDCAREICRRGMAILDHDFAKAGVS